MQQNGERADSAISNNGNVGIVALQTAEESGQQGSLVHYPVENLHPSLQSYWKAGANLA
jgi:hypothetical protein